MRKKWELRASGILSIIAGAIVVLLGIWVITKGGSVFWMMWYWKREIVGVGVLALVSGTMAIIGGTFVIRKL
jgi:hypothetical protein